MLLSKGYKYVIYYIHILYSSYSCKYFLKNLALLLNHLLYYLLHYHFQVYLFPIKSVDINSLATNLFTPPYIMDIIVTITSCFFLQNLYARFQSLNDLWKCLPPGLVAVPGQWTNIEILVLMENTRLMHSELCELLKKFTLGYGLLLLGFYTFSFITMLIGIYFFVNDELLAINQYSGKNYRIVIPILAYIQIFAFLVSIIIFVSSINEKRMKIMSYLRSYQISNLHPDIKRQIKMFMQQISANDLDQISAFGFFDIDLTLVTSMLVLLMTGISTMIQMKDHPIILQLNHETKSFLTKVFKDKF
uniref:Gustatory receptor n=1 Tax=Schizaphis graminum TaxID=13262 RepID=A0A2S2NAB9_SCHGA